MIVAKIQGPAPSARKLRVKHWLALIVATWLLVVLVWWLMPEGPLDLSKEEEPFRSMVLPPKSVVGVCFEGGEVVGMIMTDHADVKYLISFPLDYEAILNPHPTAYSIDDTDQLSSTPLKDPERAKQIVVSLLRDYGKDDDVIGSTRAAIRELAPPIREVPSRLFERVKRHLD